MNKNLLIVGANAIGIVAKEIAESIGCFEKIAFIDDRRKTTPNGIEVVGTTKDAEHLVCDYYNVIVVVDNPEERLTLIRKFEEEIPCRIVTLVSPRAYVAASAQIGMNCIVEPMVVVNSGSVVSKGCFISAGAVINYQSMICDGAHVDCNATVADNTIVPAGMKICYGEVFKRDFADPNDLFFDADRCAESLNRIAVKAPHGNAVTN